jgi:hypothetical protein
MNIAPCIVWAKQILSSYDTLTQEEQTVFGFVKEHRPIVEELHEVVQASTAMSAYLKINGASTTTIKECLRLIGTMENSIFRGVADISTAFGQYLLDILEKLPTEKGVRHVSSDIIESCFGKYKGRKSPNPLDGVTRQVLILPLLCKLNPETMKVNINFKQALETNLLSDLEVWSNGNLTENLTVKRRNVLKAA